MNAAIKIDIETFNAFLQQNKDKICAAIPKNPPITKDDEWRHEQVCDDDSEGDNVFITTYDPFGRNRMIYTIQNGCKEDPELPYDDGARTIFLYTGGTEGNPPEELLQLARYMECSVSVNVQTAGLARLHEMVMKVKADREVGATYMNLMEIEKRITVTFLISSRDGFSVGDVSEASSLTKAAVIFVSSVSRICESST